MTPEKQQIAIAKVMGFPEKSLSPDARFVWIITEQGIREHKVPRYLHDLNSMHEAEKVLDVNQQSQYIRKLEEGFAKHFQPTDWYWEATHATAAERAEAFLRTLNLWKE